MAMLLKEGTGAVAATVWLRAGDQLRPAATYPPDLNPAQPLQVSGQTLPDIAGADQAVPALHRGELLGGLSVTKRRGESLTAIEEKLFADLANQAGFRAQTLAWPPSCWNASISSRVSPAVGDGAGRGATAARAQPSRWRAAALRRAQGQARARLRHCSSATRSVLSRRSSNSSWTQTNTRDVRDLARGVYPPLLAEKGLVVALELQAAKGTVPITVDALRAMHRFPQEIEAAVYFCVLEALQNVQNYAAASRAVIRLREDEGQLRFEVEDDGCGFDPVNVSKGSGLVNMTDRLDALGGAMRIDSWPGGGCRLQASLPLQIPAYA